MVTWEDPSCFADIALELGERCGQPIPFASGSEVSNAVMWEVVLLTIVHDAHSVVGVWNIIWERLSEQSQIRTRYGAEEVSGEHSAKRLWIYLMSF